jgi:Glutamyl-tRNAGlu reductase, N-terminal domain/Shikimate / quinate 5-dehydrogenase
VTVQNLQVLHSSEATLALPVGIGAAALRGDALVLHTCQRILAVTLDAATSAVLQSELTDDERTESQTGAAAYDLLLRLACGLESRLAGETEVFGQFKQCWSDFAKARSPLAGQLSGTMQALFRDVKDIRSRFLTGTGSASYGSLVRRVLASTDGGTTHSENAMPVAPVLLIGAGQLAQSVAPWLNASDLLIWNRNVQRAHELADELRRRDRERRVVVLGADTAAELAAWRSARDVVVCIPPDAERDRARIAAWMAPRAERGRLVHLGFSELPGNGCAHRDWESAPNLLHLGHMYDLLRASNEQRRAQLDQARRACEDKSLQALAPRGGQRAAGSGRGATNRVN